MNYLLLAKTTKKLSDYRIDASVSEGLKIAFAVLMTILAIALTILILVQKGTNENVGALSEKIKCIVKRELLRLLL